MSSVWFAESISRNIAGSEPGEKTLSIELEFIWRVGRESAACGWNWNVPTRVAENMPMKKAIRTSAIIEAAEALFDALTVKQVGVHAYK